MKTEVLKYANLIIRSAAVEKRRQQAVENQLVIEEAVYRFSGFDSDFLQVYNREFSSSLDDGTIIFNECPAVFFDQTPYMFIITLDDDTIEARVFSPSAALCESADWDEKTKRLSIPVNFGNDLGQFEICWEWEDSFGNRKSASIRSEVYSTKLDIYTHFKIMLDSVQERYKWIQLDLLRQTSWGWSHDHSEDKTLKTWLLIFHEVRIDMDFRLKKLISQHRKRLLTKEERQPADRIQKMPHHLEEKIVEGLVSNDNKKYLIERKYLSSDTAENQYMKHIFFQTYNQLNDVIEQIETSEHISDIYKERLREWSHEWSMLKQHRFWRGIGSFHGLRRESQVLSQDPLYSGIRRSWYLLQQGLKFFKNELQGGIQNAAQLYEIWCLVKIEEIIRDNGWFCVEGDDSDFRGEEQALSISEEDVNSGSAKLIYKKSNLENVELHLLFQPTAGPKENKSQGLWDGMAAYPIPQRPDIVLRLFRNDLSNKSVYTWIFDAKYRIKNNFAPEDAVNQMHRYRDAILWTDENSINKSDMKREGIGAYVLYPGKENELKADSCQLSSINKTNIGAFPLRPDDKNYKPRYLGKKIKDFLKIPETENLVQDFQPQYGEKVEYGLCTTRTHMRNQNYWNKCRLYRLPQKAVTNNMKDPQNWKYLVPSFNNEHFGFFPILNVKLMRRKEIVEAYRSKGIYIDHRPNKDDTAYYLFYLDRPLSKHLEIESLHKDIICRYVMN